MNSRSAARLLVSAVLALLTLGAAASSASAAPERFYWRNGYVRGPGRAPALDCGAGVLDEGLCYPACPAGFKGVGPVCWKGLVSHDRGAAAAPRLDCGRDEAAAGLCYPPCRPGFHGDAATCRGDAPPGYVDCGSGFARSAADCAAVVAEQAAAAAAAGRSVLPRALAAARDAAAAKAGADGVAQARAIEDAAAPLALRILPAIERLARDAAAAAEAVPEIQGRFVEFADLHPDRVDGIQKALIAGGFASGPVAALKQAMDGADGPLDMTRRIARAAAVTDPTPVSALIAAFAYPVYSPPPAPRRTGWDSRATVFGVDDAGHLKYFRLEGARVVARGDLGGGFGGMKFLTAGDDGELYAVLANGMLHYYKLDSRLRWVVQGRMIGSGFGRFTSFFAGGTRRGGERVLYGVQDGELMAFRFTAGEKPDELEAKKIGWSWGPGNFPVVLGGPGGVVYAVRSGFSPALLRFRFDGSAAPSPETAGRGWGGLPQVFGGPRGAVFAVDRDGRLLLYRDPGRGRPLAGPETVGEGFGLRHLTAMKSW